MVESSHPLMISRMKTTKFSVFRCDLKCKHQFCRSSTQSLTQLSMCGERPRQVPGISVTTPFPACIERWHRHYHIPGMVPTGWSLASTTRMPLPSRCSSHRKMHCKSIGPECTLPPVTSQLVTTGMKDFAMGLAGPLSGLTLSRKILRNLATTSGITPLQDQTLLGSSSLEGRSDVMEDSNTYLLVCYRASRH